MTASSLTTHACNTVAIPSVLLGGTSTSQAELAKRKVFATKPGEVFCGWSVILLSIQPRPLKTVPVEFLGQNPSLTNSKTQIRVNSSKFVSFVGNTL